MTPKEKAIDLMNTFKNGGWRKEHSMSCVDEIIKSFDSFMDSRKNFRHELEIEAERYWIQVREELKNLK